MQIIDKNIIKVFANDYPTEYPEPESTVEVLVDNFKVVEKSVSMNERIGGKSSINVWKSIDYMIKVSLAVIIDSIHFRKGNRVEK